MRRIAAYFWWTGVEPSPKEIQKKRWPRGSNYRLVGKTVSYGGKRYGLDRHGHIRHPMVGRTSKEPNRVVVMWVVFSKDGNREKWRKLFLKFRDQACEL